ncbi:MAG: hypothetical protein HOV94_12995 [Saccharothrix sp.]|nr:hypothetical protein [Saccharothrix sp.]
MSRLRRSISALLSTIVVCAGSPVAVAQPQAAPAALHVQGEVQLATYGLPWLNHTIRHADGSWDGFGTVPDSSPPQYYDQLTAAIVAGEAHFVFEGVGTTHHPPFNPYLGQQIRHADGTWTLATVPVGDYERTADLAVASVSDELHLVRRKQGDSVLRHHVRHADGTWSSLPDLPDPVASDSSAGVAGLGDELHVLLGSPADRVLTYRVARRDGTWSAPTPVSFNPVTGVMPSTVDMARVGAELHVVVRGVDGMLYHSVRRSSGSWETFHSINSQIPMPEGVYDSVSITGAVDTLHVAVTTAHDSGLFHAIRRADGTWSRFGDVRAEAGRSGGHAVAIAGT